MARVVAVETPHHITQRGNARRAVFDSDGDRLAYLNLLDAYSRMHRLQIVGYCLMPNHVHLIAIPLRTDAMHRALHTAHGRYSAYLNARESRTGHIWQARFYSCPMDDNHFWTALRYVERNPVRAGMVKTAESYPWSSAAIHCGADRSPWLLDLGAWRSRWTPAEWREFLAFDPSQQAAEAEKIRARTLTGRPLGSATFARDLGFRLGRPLVPQKGGRPRLATV
jgi:putative transposase